MNTNNLPQEVPKNIIPASEGPHHHRPNNRKRSQWKRLKKLVWKRSKEENPVFFYAIKELKNGRNCWVDSSALLFIMGGKSEKVKDWI